LIPAGLIAACMYNIMNFEYCLIENRTLNGASQRKLIVVMKLDK